MTTLETNEAVDAARSVIQDEWMRKGSDAALRLALEAAAPHIVRAAIKQMMDDVRTGGHGYLVGPEGVIDFLRYYLPMGPEEALEEWDEIARIVAIVEKGSEG